MEKLATAPLGKRLCCFGESLRRGSWVIECSRTDKLVVFSESIKPVLDLTEVGVVGLVARGAAGVGCRANSAHHVA